MDEQRNVKIIKEINKCESCKLKEILKRDIEKARNAQEYYLTQVRKVNGTLAKYTQKLEELEKKTIGINKSP